MVRWRRARLGLLGLALLAAAPGARAEDVPPAAVLASLPFLSDAPNRVTIDLAPEDAARRFPMLLDTGATSSVLTPLMARQLGVTVRRHKSSPYRRPTILGRDLQFWVDDRTSESASKTGFEYGLLGGEFLREYVLELDFARRRVRFLDRKAYAVPDVASRPGDAVLELQVVANRPHLDVVVNGQELRMLVDTGNPFSAGVMGRTARKFDIETAAVEGLRVYGVRGPLDVSLGEAERLALGPIVLESVPLLVEAGNYNQGDSTGAILGYDVLAQFLVRIDYDRRRVLLRRNPDAVMSFGGFPWRDLERSGIAWAPLDDTRREVVWVIAGSPGDRLGVEPGDQISTAQLLRLGIDPDALTEHVAGGGDLVVARQKDDGLVEVELPGWARPADDGPGEDH